MALNRASPMVRRARYGSVADGALAQKRRACWWNEQVLIVLIKFFAFCMQCHETPVIFESANAQMP
ncbi:hypothetical protein [Solimonas marina]|uniref:hypothetical protein n=1 Tax=Solimonas marina TaxID=2714601 RepID=UPI00143ABB3F|nr:hypothetical protein [Solimonas marina]